MDGAAPIHGFSGYEDLSGREVKRRLLLGQGTANISDDHDLDWSASQLQASILSNIPENTPYRLGTDSRIVPVNVPQAVITSSFVETWTSQPQENGYLYSEDPIYNNRYYSDPATQPQYAGSWPPAASQVQEPQFLTSRACSDVIYDTSASSSFASASNFGSALYPVQTAVPLNGYQDPSIQLGDTITLPRCESLLRLDSLVTQLLQTITRYHHSQYQEMLYTRDNHRTDEYIMLKTQFEQAKSFVSGSNLFIVNTLAQAFAIGQQDIIRRANIATIITVILSANFSPFFDLNRFFLEALVPLGHRLLKWEGAVYLELKTQAYIAALLGGKGTPEALLDELFPEDLDSYVLQRHPDAPSLSPSEQDFVDRCRARRQYLAAQSYAEATRVQLPRRYQWTEFVREFHNCICKNLDHILNASHRSQAAMVGVVNRRRTGSSATSSIHDNSALSQMDIRRSTSNAGHSETKKMSANGTTIRQAWTKAEEEALMMGLERVNGPHWSQILALFGRGGSINEVLKDRNQVQLKDKARNLKLWYLKMGQDVPVSLRGVTGELRKRGGARARAALEAEEQGLAAAMDNRSHTEDPEGEGSDPVLDIR